MGKPLRRRAGVAGVGAALVLATLATAATSGASDSAAADRTPRGLTVVTDDGGSRTLVADSAVDRKKPLVRAVRAQRERSREQAAAAPAAEPADDGTGGGHGDQTGFPVRDQWLTSHQVQRLSVPGGGRGAAGVAGATFVEVPFMEYYAVFTDTTSDVAWLGRRPFDADSIKHTDTWSIGSVGAPFVVVGAPESASTETAVSGAEVSWSTTAEDTWFSRHEHDRVAFYPPDPDAYSNVFRISHTVTGTFQFGASFFTVTTRSRAYT